MESNSRLQACVKACKFYNIIVDVSAISSFTQLLRCEADMVASCHVVLYLHTSILGYLRAMLYMTIESVDKCYTLICTGFHRHIRLPLVSSGVTYTHWPNPSLLCYNTLICTHVSRSLRKIAKHV